MREGRRDRKPERGLVVEWESLYEGEGWGMNGAGGIWMRWRMGIQRGRATGCKYERENGDQFEDGMGLSF